MNIPEKHNCETRKLLGKIPKEMIAKWLLEEGYYPEQYVMPPCFKVNKFTLNIEPYFKVKGTKEQPKFEPEKAELINISFPKTPLTDRTLGIITPKIYHDIVWYLINDWDLIRKSLFKSHNKIYSYSFPIPLTTKKMGYIGNLRSGRMIYEFLEMAESDLVAEAYNYKYVLKTDIKNFYPSIYTHSIAWAIHSKNEIRKKGNRSNFNKFVGLIIDKLFQAANDGCTNGIAIGPAVSDLIAELILSSIDTEFSKLIDGQNIDFLAVRFKDDYRFLCQSKQDANVIIKTLQKQLASFNLTLNEKKSIIEELPEGLFREWTASYQPYSLRSKITISYKEFENAIRGTLKVDQQYEGTGVIDRFLSELYTKELHLKFDFNNKDLFKAISLLLMLKEKRNKSFPQILGIIEQILETNKNNKQIVSTITLIVQNLLDEKIKNQEDNQYDIIWLVYFVESLNLFSINYPTTIASKLVNSIKINRTDFFKPIPTNIKVFESINQFQKHALLDHLAIFKKEHN